MKSVRITFKPTGTTVKYKSLIEAAIALGVGRQTVLSWANKVHPVPPYLAVEVLSTRIATYQAPEAQPLIAGNSNVD